ncbi:hypothetical protein ARMGADRAFT_822955 [Armillaria gallica]|uniref:Uncharacterized protein n=1 Tax=Armillaria gallica TaxID=47427 RepID=A0A2H3CXF1_ARMGA|nr:hypothetical protein ARMGADRAFT_822955 [Armillaria gallica]
MLQDGALERQSSREQDFFIFPGQHIEQTLNVMAMSAPEMTKTCYPAFTLSHLCTSIHTFVFFDLFFRKSVPLTYGWTTCLFICVPFRASRGEGMPAPEMAAFALFYLCTSIFSSRNLSIKTSTWRTDDSPPAPFAFISQLIRIRHCSNTPQRLLSGVPRGSRLQTKGSRKIS